MKLSESDLIKLIRKKPNNDNIWLMKSYESRLKMMTEPLFFRQLEMETGWGEFKGAIRSSLTQEKYEKVLNFFSFPLAIVSVCNDIVEDLNRVWSGRNANFDIQFPNKQSESRSQDLIISLNTRSFIEKVGRKAFKCKPQTIVVIDKDEDGTPYYLEVDLNKLMGYELTECKQEFKYIIFLHSEGVDEIGEFKKYAVYDDEFYRVVEDRNNVLSLITENPHNLGSCPAKFFVDVELSDRSHDRKFAPLASVLGPMSEWQQFYTYSFYAEHYGVFPVIEYAAAICEDEYCVNGMVSQPLQTGEMSVPTACPSCSNNKFNGAGTAIKINPSIDKDENDSKGYFKFISPPTGNLEFEMKKQNERENFIKVNTVGFNDMLNKEAVNADQVRSLMEDRKKPLMRLSGIAGRLHKWMLESALKLAYDMDVKVHANYGTEWFLLTEEELQMLFKSAKDSGLPESEIEQIYKLMLETKYKGDPQTVAKLLIENSLNPAPYNTMDECYIKSEKGVMQPNDLYIKANFTKFVSKFERENGSLVEFAKDINFDQKINTIYNTFINYIKDEKQSQEESGISNSHLSQNKELQQLMNQFPNNEFPVKIPVHNIHCYNFIGIRVRRSAGISQQLQIHLFTKTVEAWEAMSDELKTPSAIGNFNQVIMIHDPYIQEEKRGRLTEAKKTRINRLMEDGGGVDDTGLREIANNVGLGFEQVKNYIKSF